MIGISLNESELKADSSRAAFGTSRINDDSSLSENMTRSDISLLLSPSPILDAASIFRRVVSLDDEEKEQAGCKNKQLSPIPLEQTRLKLYSSSDDEEKEQVGCKVKQLPPIPAEKMKLEAYSSSDKEKKGKLGCNGTQMSPIPTTKTELKLYSEPRRKKSVSPAASREEKPLGFRPIVFSNKEEEVAKDSFLTANTDMENLEEATSAAKLAAASPNPKLNYAFNFGENVASPHKSLGRDIMQNILSDLLLQNEQLSRALEKAKAQLQVQKSIAPPVSRDQSLLQARTVMDDQSWFYCKENGYFMTRPKQRTSPKLTGTPPITPLKLPRISRSAVGPSPLSSLASSSKVPDDDSWFFCEERGHFVPRPRGQGLARGPRPPRLEHSAAGKVATPVPIEIGKPGSIVTNISPVAGDEPRSTASSPCQHAKTSQRRILVTPEVLAKDTMVRHSGCSMAASANKVADIPPATNEASASDAEVAALKAQVSTLQEQLKQMAATNQRQTEKMDVLKQRVILADLTMSILNVLNDGATDNMASGVVPEEEQSLVSTLHSTSCNDGSTASEQSNDYSYCAMTHCQSEPPTPNESFAIRGMPSYRFQQYVRTLQKGEVWGEAIEDAEVQVDTLLDAPLERDNLEDILDWAAELYSDCRKEEEPTQFGLVLQWEPPPEGHEALGISCVDSVTTTGSD